MVSSSWVCVDVHTDDADYRGNLYLCSQGHHSIDSFGGEKSVVPCGGGSHSLGLRPSCLGRVSAWKRDDSGPNVTGRRRRQDRSDEWMGVECPSEISWRSGWKPGHG